MSRKPPPPDDTHQNWSQKKQIIINISNERRAKAAAMEAAKARTQPNAAAAQGADSSKGGHQPGTAAQGVSPSTKPIRGRINAVEATTKTSQGTGWSAVSPPAPGEAMANSIGAVALPSEGTNLGQSGGDDHLSADGNMGTIVSIVVRDEETIGNKSTKHSSGMGSSIIGPVETPGKPRAAGCEDERNGKEEKKHPVENLNETSPSWNHTL